MFHSKILNNKINRLQEKALRIVYSVLKANFDKFLENDSSFSIQHRKIQTLVIEIFKFLYGLSPPKMNTVFQVEPSAPYSLRDKNELYSRNPKTMTSGTESISFLSPMVNSASGNEKLSISIFFRKYYKEMETNLPMSLTLTLLATCWFYIIKSVAYAFNYFKSFFFIWISSNDYKFYICYTLEFLYCNK